MAPSTPSFSENIRLATEAHARGLRVLMPGRIVEYDAPTNRASVRPDFKQILAPGGEAVRAPVIENVPVAFPRVGLAVITFPVRVGDKVSLQFTDRALDRWLDGAGEHDPDDVRSHDYSDAFATLGPHDFNDPIPLVDPADIRIILFDENGAVRSQFYLGGDTGDAVLLVEREFRVGSASADQSVILGELFKAFFDLHVHATGVGPSGPPTLPMDAATLLSTILKTAVNPPPGP